MYVQPEIVKKIVVFPPQCQQFEQTIIFQSRGFEPFGMVFWPRGAVIAPLPPFPDFFFSCIFQNVPCTLGEKKEKCFFKGVGMCRGKTNICFFSLFFASFPICITSVKTILLLMNTTLQMSRNSNISQISCQISCFPIMRDKRWDERKYQLAPC